MSVRTNVRRNRGTRLSNDLSDALDYAVRQWAPGEIVVLPLTWREPAAVAMNTLMALWLHAYFADPITGAQWPNPYIILPSLDGTDRYIEALDRNATGFYDWLAPIFERDVVSLLGPEHVLDRKRVTFDWTESS